MKKETRTAGLLRAVGDETGIIEAYLTKWGTVDSYNSTFRKGAFKKTFREKGASKIRLLWNHDTLAGKVLSVREDDTGPFVQAKFNLDTTAGRDAYAHVKNGDVDCFSFGFYPIREGMKDGVREIIEVDILECGPVVFEANPQAAITDIRAQEFEETLADIDVNGRGDTIRYSLYQTLDEIFWNAKPDEWVTKSEEAINSFRENYLQWLNDWLERFDNGQRSAPITNNVAAELRKIAQDGLEKFAARSAFTLAELNELRAGNTLSAESLKKLDAYPDLKVAHDEARAEKIKTTLTDLRAGISDTEKNEIAEILGMDIPIKLLSEFVSKLETQLTGGN